MVTRLVMSVILVIVNDFDVQFTSWGIVNSLLDLHAKTEQMQAQADLG